MKIGQSLKERGNLRSIVKDPLWWILVAIMVGLAVFDYLTLFGGG